MIGAVAGFGPSVRIAPVGLAVRIEPVAVRIEPVDVRSEAVAGASERGGMETGAVCVKAVFFFGDEAGNASTPEKSGCGARGGRIDSIRGASMLSDPP